MNKLDIKFYNLLRGFKILNSEVIFDNIKSTYSNVSETNKKAIEKFLATFNYWGKLDYEANIFEELENRCKVLKEHADDFLWLYKSLGDYRSKQVLYGILNYWYNSDFQELGLAREETYNQYFDLDLVRPKQSAVYVDIGAYTGDTIINYINTYLNYKRIYAYEITDESIKTMQNNLKEYPNIIFKKKAAMDVNSEFFINNNIESASANTITDEGSQKVIGVTLDSDIKEKIDLIKMDIEGCEERALKGAIGHIKNDTPILLISVYHNHNDLWKLPKLIYSVNDNYQFFLRYFGNRYYPTEIVLIAIPK